MANKIEVTGLDPNNFIDDTSRYRGLKILYYGDNRLITFETYKKHDFVPTSRDRNYVITKGTEYRPDLVSAKVYGEPRYWWRIMEANGLKDIWDFKAGTNIIIPGGAI